MAAKIILSMDGSVIQEYPLDKERMTIGRKSHNEIVIDNLAVSGEHAAIVTILHDSFLEDLDSTNGLEVNGVAVKKHFLQNNDVIEIGKYKLKYINDHVSQTTAADFEKTMVLRAPVVTPVAATAKAGETAGFMNTQINPDITPHEEKQTETAADRTGKFEASPIKPAAPVAAEGETMMPPKLVKPAQAQQVAAIQVLSGPNAGKELELVKSLTTLGKPGVQVAVLTRRPHGFFITHVEGANHPTVNGQAIGDQPQQLHDHDVIDLAGVKMEFYFKS
ncbi:MAG: FHA domain-containing protein [Pseudomonadota bacterium]